MAPFMGKSRSITALLGSIAPRASGSRASVRITGPLNAKISGADSRRPAWIVSMAVSPKQFSRMFHSSTISSKKGTQSIRTSRIADATGVDPNSVEFAELQRLLQQKQSENQKQEQQKDPNDIKDELNLFEIDRQKLFIFATGAVVFIFILFLGTAEFMFNWYMTMDEVTGELVEAPLSTRLRWSAFFTFVGVFMLVSRWFWGNRFINKIDLLPGSKFRITTYSFWGTKTSQVFHIADILPNHVNVSPAYYTFKFHGNTFYHMVDRTGRIPSEEKLLSLLHARNPMKA